MANVKIGNLDISAFKVGSDDCKVYLGDTLLYPQNVSYKLQVTYSGGVERKVQCDDDSTLSTDDTKPSGYNEGNMLSAIIGDCVEAIEDNAFEHCTSLTSVTIPNSVTSIGNNVFDSCYSLESITIGSGVTSIGDSVFVFCGSLESITVDSSNSSYDSRNNCNAIIETSTNALLFGCSNTVIPNSVTSIGESAFYNTSITSITIPNSVTSVGYDAFAGCGSLTSVTIGSGITSIDEGAFRECSSLEGVIINALTPPTLGSDVFYGDCPIYVPSASVNAYKAAWPDYESRIEEIQ